MLDHDILAELARVALLWIVGALSALGEIFNRDEIPGARKIIGRIISGGFAALAIGAIIVKSFPELKEDIVFLSGIGGLAGFVGLPYVFCLAEKLLKKWVENVKLPEDTKENRAVSSVEKPQKRKSQNIKTSSKKDLSDDEEYSVRTKKLFDSGEFSEEDIRQMKADYLLKKSKNNSVGSKSQ